MNNQDALLILNAVCGLGPMRVKKLISFLGSASAVLLASPDDLGKVSEIPEHAVQNICHFAQDKFLLHEYNLMAENQVEAITVEDERYPGILKEIYDAPIVLYVKGNVDVLNDFAVGIVGSRHASLYGVGVAQKFAMEMANYGVTVVSGMARGIDTAAHEGALRANGSTVAVLGCGLKFVYPLENKKLSELIARQGAVISEFPMETPPASFNFPRRNRIISGLSRGIVVVEAALKSGALITSDFALEHGREVFAVPGQVGSPFAQGTNQLIKQGAKLTSSVEDIFEELAPQLLSVPKDLDAVNRVKVAKHNFVLSVDEEVVWRVLGDDPLDIEELLEKSGFQASQASQVLLNLEFKKLIKQLPGQKYQKIKSSP